MSTNCRNKKYKQIALNAILGAQYLFSLKTNFEVGRPVEMQIQIGAALGCQAQPNQVKSSQYRCIKKKQEVYD